MCDTNIHDDLINMEEAICPYCFELLVKGNTTTDLCCENPQIDEIDGIQVCRSCGLVHSCLSKSDYLDFYENIYRIHRKSIYMRKYHIENTLNSLLLNHGVELTYNQRDRIYKIFEDIGSIISQINNNRKRMISIKFIIKKILEIMDLSYNIPVTRSKKTLEYYNKHWHLILALIGDKIEKHCK